MLWHRGTARIEVPMLIFLLISFELTQHIRPRYVNVADRQTDRQTDIHTYIQTDGEKNEQTDGPTTYDSNTALCTSCIAR